MAHLLADKVLGMAVLRAHGVDMPLRVCVDEDGLATVTVQRLSLKFHFREETVSIEEEIYDETNEITHTLDQVSKKDDDNNRFLNLYPDRYRVYGLTESQLQASIEILTPRRSSTCTIQTPSPRDVKVKVEPGLDTPDVTPVISLSSDEETSPLKASPDVPRQSVESSMPTTLPVKCASTS